tara:strand:- start:8721 stop:9443 length:723 start_codon:yes stop_codon:yes gene_type:complete
VNLIASVYIKDNKVVKVKSGDFRTLKFYHESPIDLIQRFEDLGVKEIYFVDLGSAKMHEKNNFILLEMISQFSNIKINYSGGLRTSETVSSAFINGANMVTLGSMPVYDKNIFLNCLTTWGFKKIVMAVDIWKNSLRINGWKHQTKIDPLDHIDYFSKKGLMNIKVTDISKDGTLDGPPFSIYKKILKKYPHMNMTTGGGIRGIKDIEKLRDIGIKNVIFGRAFYDGNITLNELKNYLKK